MDIHSITGIVGRPTLRNAICEAYDAVFGDRMREATDEACRIAGVDDVGKLSDGYHTFDSLYRQRGVLFAALVNLFPELSWKSWRDERGEPWFGGKDWFLVCIETPDGPYSYHCQASDWDMYECAELEKAKPFDGHTDKDVERLLSLVPERLPGSVVRSLSSRGGDRTIGDYMKPAPLVESVKYVKGHKNSKGEDAPWTIVSHETGKILSSHKSENEARKHLQQMEYFKHKG